jgi:serine/threonine-protein kinase
LDDRDVFGKTIDASSDRGAARETDPQGLPAPGATILDGKYRVDRVIGMGGMGVVMQATHVAIGQRVAFKFLLPSVARDHDDSSERFLREARAAANVRGDHVVRVMDVGRLENGTPYMLMEYLDGSDLAEHLAHAGPLPIATSVDWVLQACEAIAEAHAAGIIHRDLKPSNLFLAHRADASTTLKVLDFGISKTISTDVSGSDTLTKPGAFLGSPLYMSPEQIRSSTRVDARSDVWALGIILYELLTGAPMFTGPSYSAICAAVASDPAPRLRRVLPSAPEGLEAAILRCVEKQVENRFDSVGELARAIAPFGSPGATASAERVVRFLRRGGITLRGPGPPAPQLPSAAGVAITVVDRPVFRRPVRRAVIAAVAVLAVAAGLLVFRATRSRRVDSGAASAAPSVAQTAMATATAETPPPSTGTSPASDALAIPAPPSSSASPGPSLHPASGVPPLTGGHPKRGAPSPSTAPGTSAPAAPAPAPSSRSESELLDHRL